MTAPSLFIMVGEASGDRLGAEVMKGLAARNAACDCWGVGGDAMQSLGFGSVMAMDDFTVLGVGEAIKAIPRLNRLANTLIDRIMETRPDAILTIDNKGFSMRFARRLKKRMARAGWHAPILHLVAPTVWAWGGWRARGVAKSVDHLMCLFPFEEPYFTRHGVEVTVVGHPSAERPRPGRDEARGTLGIDPDRPLLALLPGSRSREVATLLPDMLRAFSILKAELPSLQAVLPMASNVASGVTAMVGRITGEGSGHDQGLHLRLQDDLDAVLAASDAGMICSGTVTLEAALAGLPGAVYYRPDWLARKLGNIFVERSNVVLANAIMGEEIYPLYLNDEFSPQSMADAALPLLTRPGTRITTLGDTLTVKGGFGRTSADVIIRSIKGKS